jgi:hypothetical protein
MKLIESIKAAGLTCVLAILATGCVYFPTTTRMVAIAPQTKSDVVLEAAVDAAQDVDFPPMTKMDKANGIVEFGSFEMPELGITAQVRVRSDGSAEITVKRGSTYIRQGVDKQADAFKAKFEEKLHEAEQKAAK